MKTPLIKYEPEDDVLNIWLSEKPIDDAEDIDGAIIHYTEEREPVYIEILFASRFLTKKDKPFSGRVQSLKQSSVAIPHRIK